MTDFVSKYLAELYQLLKLFALKFVITNERPRQEVKWLNQTADGSV